MKTVWATLTLFLLTAAANTDPPTGKESRPRPLLVLRGHSSSVSCVQFSPSGKHLATGSWDTTVVLWNADTGMKQFILKGHTADVRGVAFGPGGILATAGYNDGTVRVWDTHTGRALTTLPSCLDGLYGLTFGPRGQHVTFGGCLSLSEHTGGLLIRAARSSKVGSSRRLDSPVSSLAYSRDRRRLATGLWDGRVVVWEVASMSPALILGEKNAEPAWSVAFRGDGKQLVATGWGGVVRVWSLPSGKECSTLTGHAGRTHGVSFSPDGKWLGSSAVIRPGTQRGDYGGEVIVRSAATGVKQFTLVFPEGQWVFDFCFSPDSTRLATAHRDGTLRIWSVKQLLEKAQPSR
jgi:WD40 repeat protein